MQTHTIQAGTTLCCAACLHAITEPEAPVLHQDRFFHVGHLPQESTESLLHWDVGLRP